MMLMAYVVPTKGWLAEKAPVQQPEGLLRYPQEPQQDQMRPPPTPQTPFYRTVKSRTSIREIPCLYQS